jgi:hypothetical protein
VAAHELNECVARERFGHRRRDYSQRECQLARRHAPE